MSDYQQIPIVGLPTTPPPLITVPAIKIAKPKWARDSGVTELIEYFDRPELMGCKNNAERWGKLKANEVAEILKVVQRCRDDFQYCARNFFWLSTKDRGDKLFTLWEGQCLLLEFMLQLKAKKKAQRVLIIKGRQLGCSTLIEALIAWRTMLFVNITAFVVADEPARATELFGLMTYFIDHVPWWLQPMMATREYKEGLKFENPDPEQRRTNPGLNSKVIVNAANKLTGVAQGYKVNAAHCSEFPSWSDKDARTIIEEDLGNALADNVETFAFLEGTAKGAGRYAHKLWIKSFNLGEDSKWSPIFLPSFFEASRVLAPPQGWTVCQEETDIRERVVREWTRCDSEVCLQYHERWFRGADREGEICPTCEAGTLQAYTLTDAQCAWFERERKNCESDPESLKNMMQEMCVSAEDSFQASGYKSFSDLAQNWAKKNVEEPYMRGIVDKSAKFHGCDPRKKRPSAIPGETWNACFQPDCGSNHQFDNSPLHIFRFPEKGRKYFIGADVGEGLGGDNNSSVAFVLKAGILNQPDEQVAVFRSNAIDRISYAEFLVSLGYFYNKALLAVESNKFDTVASWVQSKLNYPNCYRPRLESGNVSIKLGWDTTERSKGRLYDTMYRWLEAHQVIIHSRNFCEEMKTFKRMENGKLNGRSTYGAALGFADDELMAGCISLFVCHAHDYDENLGYVAMKADVTFDNAQWQARCHACNETWGAASTAELGNCPKCRSLHVSASKNPNFVKESIEDPEWDLMTGPASGEPTQGPEYDLL